MMGVGWYRMRCQSVLEKICQENSFFFLVFWYLKNLKAAHPGGKGGGGGGSSFGSKRSSNTKKFTGSNGKKNTGGGGQLELELELDGIVLPLLKNTAGKSQMKLKDIESVYIYIESIWKYDAYVFILGKFFHHSVRWRH